MNMREIQSIAEKLTENVEKVIVGKKGSIRLVIIGLMCQGHVLIEDVPGTGKTMLAKSLARSIGGTFKRIQFTPDMLPTDVIGVSIYNQKTMEFEFRPGPIMSQIVLTDEINRATPKTQAALLEAMEERQITVDGVTHPMPEPFLVLATQNPIEYEGTFPLPEAQLDRFLLRIEIGYPSPVYEIEMMGLQKISHPIESLTQIISVDELIEAQSRVRHVEVSRDIEEYIVTLVNATRNHSEIYLGASPRGSLGLFRTSQARAAIDGRSYVVPDDVKAMAVSVLAHRMILGSAARIREVSAQSIVEEIVHTVPIPNSEVVR